MTFPSVKKRKSLSTAQEIFDFAVTELGRMKVQAVNRHDDCVYRDYARYKNGRPNKSKCVNQCIVGRMITDGELKKMMGDPADFCQVVGITEIPPFLIPSRLRGYIPFLNRLQSVHDIGLHWDENGLNFTGQKALRYIARLDGLSRIHLVRTFPELAV